MLIGTAYRLGSWTLGVLGAVARSDGALMAEVLALRHENAVLRRQVAPMRYKPADRPCFAALPTLIPRARRAEVFAVTPATLHAWHRRLVAGKYTSARSTPGRPSTRPAVKTLILLMAHDNPFWGRRRIQGEPAKPGHRVTYATVWEIPGAAGIDPAPRRTGPTWKQFLTTQARTIIATGFFHVDTVLLTRVCVLLFIEHHTRRLHVAEVTANFDAAWTTQQARNFGMSIGARLEDMRFLIHDRGGQFTGQFDTVFESCGLRILRGPPEAPRANAICERLIGTLRRELLDRTRSSTRHACAPS